MKNLSLIYSRVSPEVIAEGMNWYQTAHSFCARLSAETGIRGDKVCAVLSALSPGTNWNQNQRDCKALLGIHLSKLKGHKFQTYGPNVSKAFAILKGDGDPLDFFSEKTGPKTRSFYLNILNPQGNEVTIDRHAYRVATGEEYRKLTPKQYTVIADHYRNHAHKVGLRPCELQAVLWVYYRIENEIQQRQNVPF